jgi:DNA polymerase/3'-5' exonuclease PolX
MQRAFGEQNRRTLGIGPKQTESLWQRSAVNGLNGIIRELTTLARQKAPAAKIAKSLKRTLGTTRKKASELGVSLDWTRESIDRMAVQAAYNVLSVFDGKPIRENAVNPEVFD